MKVIQSNVYALFELMWKVGLWDEHGRQLALRDKYGHEHLTELRKPGLVTFATASWLAAKDAVEKADG